MPSVDRMKEFLEVAASGSISEAARVLALPRATLSRRLSGLEADLGVRLLHRRTTQQVWQGRRGSPVPTKGCSDNGKQRGVLRNRKLPLCGLRIEDRELTCIHSQGDTLFQRTPLLDALAPAHTVTHSFRGPHCWAKWQRRGSLSVRRRLSAAAEVPFPPDSRGSREAALRTRASPLPRNSRSEPPSPAHHLFASRQAKQSEAGLLHCCSCPPGPSRWFH